MEEIVIIIVQSFENFYVHQRRNDKKRFPGFYGLGAGGKVEPGEDITKAARRELKEELRLESEVEKLFDFDFPEGPYKVHVYRTPYVGEGVLPLCAEFKWGGWMNLSEIDGLASKGELCPDTKIAYERFKNEFFKY